MSYDSGAGGLRRTVVLDLNDDGFYLTVVVAYDGGLLVGVTYRGDDEDSFMPA